MQVQTCINEDGALRNQRYAFTDKFTLISELMQNARRAGALRIEITYDESFGVLRVVDDGCGIADFQKLRRLNESGWDKPTCDAERPFGIGFSRCLYSASHCNEDRNALADLIRRLRSVDPKATLDSLLQELKLEKYPLLRGRSFRPTVGHSHDGHVVDVMSPTDTGRP